MPKCSECGSEIIAALGFVIPGASWLCLDCSGATLEDFDIEEDEIDDDFYFPSPYEIAEDDDYEF